MTKVKARLKELNNYIDNIRKDAYKDIFYLENQVLNKNTDTSDFINNYLYKQNNKKISYLFFIKKIILYYIKSVIKFVVYIISFILFRLIRKKNIINYNNKVVLIDTFFLVDKIISENSFNERYFVGLNNVLKKHNIKYVFLPRLYGINKNPFKIIKLLNILNQSENDFLFEYELLSFTDLIKIFIYILVYPFKTILLLQKSGSTLDRLFNFEIINTLPSTPFIAYTRYLIAKKLTNKLAANSKIISWQEFQNLEKTFNKGIKESNSLIKIYGCQFLIQYKNYISMHISDIDYDLKITPHIVLLNGQHNYNISKKQIYRNGVSLRYSNIFKFNIDKKNANDIIVLLSYDVNESIRVLKLISDSSDKLKIKIHPATNEKDFSSYVNEKMEFTHTSIYDLLDKSKIVFVVAMSGTALEALSCGISVIIIARNDKLIMNPMVEYGKGKIWDIAFSKDDVKKLYNNLIKYRANNMQEIREIASWYRDNFFIEPTEENIVKAFELDKDNLK